MNVGMTADNMQEMSDASHLPAALPAYTYVPGRVPHPVNDPAGHLHGSTRPPAQPFDPECPEASAEFLRAAQLFNSGYYWEAHEEWEALWHAAGRRGLTATLLKGLIKLAAAGVKAYEGRPEGVRRHARRASELLRQAAAGAGDNHRAGLDLPKLTRAAVQLSEQAEAACCLPGPPPCAGHLGRLPESRGDG